ncbi:S-layer homology domain-containing protein [Paenibacillus cymbidii]|uniref:S-layer homology domain-containing protein n=1 Tax=Paenibacillus cymbidii TaxID=1639034 RepID=UPI0010816A17|nr:S-layer homology domain-containing protein [Paenibacillus cymbidii]
MKRRGFLTTLVVLLVLLLAPNVWAFSDTKGHPAETAIDQLRQAGVVSGYDGDSFQPEGTLTYAQAVHLMVKGFGLNIDNIRFIKEPKASDSFANVKDDAWYAGDFIIAPLNGLDIPRDIDPERAITREEFTSLLHAGVSAKGDFPIIELWVIIADEQDIDAAKMNSVQFALITKLAQLDEKQRFLPKAALKRGEAADMLWKAMQFVASHSTAETPQPSADPGYPAGGTASTNDVVAVTVEKVDDEVNRVTLSWGEKPNPGYRLTIDGISFTDQGEARISYTLHKPVPGQMYAQVITEAKASTYVAATYKSVAVPSGR